MNRKVDESRRDRQRGAALLIFMLFIFLASAYWAIGRSDATSSGNTADRTSERALALAKEALIGRAATDPNRPGSLPCPDGDDDGTADLFSGIQCPTYIGRLPWKTLGMPEPRDGTGERLWYALSPKLRDHDNAEPINPQQALDLTLDGKANIAAIVFSAGPPLAGQNGRPGNAVADYLDGSNNDADDHYVSGPSSSSFNDRVLAISRDELFRVVSRRILAEIRGPDDNSPNPPQYGLRHYHADNGQFPWADAGADGFGDAGTAAGNLPYNDLPMNAASPTRLGANGWLPLIVYQRAGPASARISIGNSTMDVRPCPASPCP